MLLMSHLGRSSAAQFIFRQSGWDANFIILLMQFSQEVVATGKCILESLDTRFDCRKSPSTQVLEASKVFQPSAYNGTVQDAFKVS